MLIYYAINIISFHLLWFLTICILDLSINCKFESIILFFLSNNDNSLNQKRIYFEFYFIFLKVKGEYVIL